MEFLWEAKEQWNGRDFRHQRKFGSEIRDGAAYAVRRVPKKRRIGAKKALLDGASFFDAMFVHTNMKNNKIYIKYILY